MDCSFRTREQQLVYSYINHKKAVLLMLNVFNLFPDLLRIKGRYQYEEKMKKVFFFWDV